MNDYKSQIKAVVDSIRLDMKAFCDKSIQEWNLKKG